MKIFGYEITKQKRESQSLSSHDESFWTSLFGGKKSRTGLSINENTAMGNTAVFACNRIISDSIAIMPLKLYKRDGKRNVIAVDHPVHKLVSEAPNPEMTPYTYKRTSVLHRTSWGNSYSFIRRDKGGRARQLWPLLPDRTRVFRDLNTGDLKYETINFKNEVVPMRAEDVLHIPGFGFDGLIGKSPIQMHMETIGLAMAAQDFGATFFGNGANPKGLVRLKKSLEDADAVERFKKSLKGLFGFQDGLDGAHNIAVLEEDAEYTQLTINPNDSQFIETRGFQKEEVATIYGVPPPLLQMMEKATSFGTGIEQLMRAFVVNTLMPYIVAGEEAMAQKLLTDKERENYYFKYNVDALLRGDFKTRTEGYKNAHWISVNEIREKEDMDPIENGDEYYRPLNMVPLGTPYTAADNKATDTDKKSDGGN